MCTKIPHHTVLITKIYHIIGGISWIKTKNRIFIHIKEKNSW